MATEPKKPAKPILTDWYKPLSPPRPVPKPGSKKKSKSKGEETE
jgi:hypothetical protein